MLYPAELRARGSRRHRGKIPGAQPRCRGGRRAIGPRTMSRRRPVLPLCLAPLALAAAGCASDAGQFPSLAQRPAEREYAAEQMSPPSVRPPLPADTTVAGRAASFVAAAREAEGGFSRAYEIAAAAA